MSYTLVIGRDAQRALARIHDPDYGRILTAIQALVNDPRPRGCKKLRNRDAWRIRIGNYRVIYEINDRALVVTVVDVGNRRDVYR
ncbi:MAG TPA: type II toxin-antitoxin system RelE/ParE family toxin [Herpetosiphonaceae bacterium]|nr:type II toxin-antitoxin system RelE/ParE family toxin [Herpetosiphonaceae bacterium]